MQNLLSELTELLSKDERLVSEGSLLKNKVIELALAVDSGLIKLLLENKSIKKHFFVDVDGVLVFDKIAFQRFVSNKEFLPESYTAFKNKIGLVNENGDYLSESREVVLAWPYKDCILEGGQTKEDQKRDESFWNETLAPDEIDRLLAPKVLTNFKKYDEKGEHSLTGKEQIDFTKENLIIKGNNLLALHSLYKNFAGKVKLIYIDPPYNTGNDSFGYNDNFNHSTWLSFVKNRLEIAKKLLRDDGSIFINIDDNEIGYLLTLMDELFGRNNFISLIAIKRSGATGHKAINPAPINVTEYVACYCLNKCAWEYKIQYTEREYDSAYSQFIENFDAGFKKWKFVPLTEKFKNNIPIDKIIEKYSDRIIRFAEPNYDGVGKTTKELINKSKSDSQNIYVQRREDVPDIYLRNGQRILFYKDKLKEIDGKIVTAEPLTNLWADLAFQGIASEGDVVLRKGKKPERLLYRIIEMATIKGDIIMDYHLGSGTTCAVAHKMGRQYIGIEQLDYGDNDSIIRLQNVIKGDQSGVSKAAQWQGGGSFISLEMTENNEAYKTRINKLKTTKELLSIWKEMQEKAFISYKVDPKKINESIAEFEKLSLEDQKRLLIETLDKNQLYVNYSEIDDKDYGVSETDKKLNRKFYGEA